MHIIVNVLDLLEPERFWFFYFHWLDVEKLMYFVFGISRLCLRIAEILVV